MKNIHRIILAALSISTSAVAHASLMTHPCGGTQTACTAEWQDSWNNRVLLSAASNGTHSQSIGFDLADDGFSAGEDSVYNYKLTFHFADDGDLSWEYAYINQPGLLGDRLWEIDLGSYGLQGSVQGISSLNQSGQLSISVQAISGDFWLKGVDLLACGVDRASEIPEPASLGLAVVGLAALSAARRRVRQ